MKEISWICPDCANLVNGRLTHRKTDTLLLDTYLDGVKVESRFTSPSRKKKCQECGRPSRHGYLEPIPKP